MKVCLLAPRWNQMANSYPPLGLGYLAAFLEQAGHEVRIFDLGLDPDIPLDDCLVEIDTFQPGLVGITAMSSNYHSALETIQRLKRLCAAPVVIGGPHASLFPERLMAEPCFDYVISGEGEETICELVQALQAHDGAPPAAALRGILGLCFRDGDEIVQNPARPLPKDLDSFPFPARHLFDIMRYPLFTPDGQRMITFLSSRGCPYHCSYCFKGIMGRTYRQRSVDNMIAELEQIIATYGLRNIYFVDDLFAMNKKRLLAFTERVVNENLNIRWQCLVRVDRIDKETLVAMAQAGCREIHYGIEAGTQEMLDKIGKQITLEQVRNAVRWTKKAGIMVKGYFMLGLPDDTEETMEATIRFACELDLDEAMFSLTTPFPGTQLWDELVLRHPDTVYSADFTNAYYYTSYEERIEPFMNLSQVSDTRLAELIQQAHIRFWESKRKRKYLRFFGKPLGTAIWHLSNVPWIRTVGQRILNNNLGDTGQRLRQGSVNSWS